MLTINNLTIQNRIDNRIIIKDFNFTLNKDDKVGIIGEEGNGKSTLLKVIVDQNILEEYFEISGHINKKFEIIGYLPQIMSEDYLFRSPKELLYENKSVEDFDYNRLYSLLEEFNITESLFLDDIIFNNLSGGEKIKAQLLLIMMDNPTILLLDEPTNDLDFNALKWTEDFITKLEIPVIFVSHDENILEKTTNRIIHIEQLIRKSEPKLTIANMNFKDYINFRNDSIIIQEKNALKEKEEFDKKMTRYRKVYDSVENALSKVSRKNPTEGKNLKDKMHTVKSMGKRFEREKENLTKRPDYEESVFFDFMYPIDLHNSKCVLDFKLDELKVGNKILSENIRLQVFGPKKVAIVGENGVGKTTLIKKIIEDSKRSNLKFGYMPQNYIENMDLNKTPVDFLKRDFTREEEIRLRTYLGSMKYTFDEMSHRISELSGGQKAKLYFLSMIIDEVQVMVLDEPTRNLSPLTGPVIRKALKNYKGSIISISHDKKYLEEVVDEIYKLTEEGLLKVGLFNSFKINSYNF